MTAIFITGASSGIGAGLAESYAAPGVTLGLAARRAEKLAAIRRVCEAKGANVHQYNLDVTDGPAVERAARDFVRATGQIDLVIANAGIGSWRHPIEDHADALTAVINTNVNGVIHTVMAFVQPMVAQRSGQIVAISSIAGFLSLPRGAYAASKAAVRYLMDSWRIDLAPFGITVTTIFPGFVASEMTIRKDFRYPFLVSVEAAVRIIRRAIDTRRRFLIFPWPWRLLLPLAKFMPDSLWRWVLPVPVVFPADQPRSDRSSRS